jgi:hypothetical protein
MRKQYLLLTRNKIMNVWQSQSKENLNKYCCPCCRDILLEDDYIYICQNPECAVNKIYKVDIQNINEKKQHEITE